MQSAIGPPPPSKPLCKCGLPAVQCSVTAQHETSSRPFFCCPRPLGQQCDFLRFDAAPVVSPQRQGGGAECKAVAVAPPDLPLCGCGGRAVRRVVKKEGANKGRVFYCCAKPREQQCGFFAFADGFATPAPAPTAGLPVALPQCDCGQPAVQRVVKKDGANFGRTFFKCAKPQEQQCRFFQFADDSAAAKRDRPQALAPCPPCEPGAGSAPSRLFHSQLMLFLGLRGRPGKRRHCCLAELSHSALRTRMVVCRLA